MKKNNLDEILKKFSEKHYNLYDYSKFEYSGYHTKSVIICKKHGEFLQTPAKHICGRGCKKCAIDSNKYTVEEILERIDVVNNNRYKIIFDKQYTKINDSYLKIECRHGVKRVRVDRFLSGQGCIYCSGQKWHDNDLREKLLEIHKCRYKYSEKFHKNKMLEVLCEYHGIFNIKKDRHLMGQGCHKCSNKKTYDIDFFKKRISEIYKNKIFVLSETFKTVNSEILVDCYKHGTFTKKAYYLLAGNGCNECSNEKKRYSTDEFLEICRIKHPEIDHSKVEYKSSNDKIKLICKKHGEFYQNASYYLNISKGCPICQETKGEKAIRIFLESMGEKFIQEYNIENRYYDFFIPSKNIFIEFNGKQHYQSVDFFGGEKTFEKQKIRDNEKIEMIKNINSKLIVIPYWKIKDINNILKKEIYED